MASADDFNATLLRQRIALLWTDFKFLQRSLFSKIEIPNGLNAWQIQRQW